jgi:hypothetical protein
LAADSRNRPRPQVLERVVHDVQAEAALYKESVRDEADLADTTGVELPQVCERLPAGQGPGQR